MQEKVPFERTLSIASGDFLHELSTKEESCNEPLELVVLEGEPLEDDEEKERVVRCSCWLFCFLLVGLFLFLLTEFYYHKIFV